MAYCFECDTEISFHKQLCDYCERKAHARDEEEENL
jgi:hypothetical protein